MIISSSAITLASSYEKTEISLQHEQLRVRSGRPDHHLHHSNKQNHAYFNHDQTRISREAYALQPSRKEGLLAETGNPLNDAKVQALVELIERLTGIKIRFAGTGDDTQGSETNSASRDETSTQRTGLRVQYDYYSARIETEQTRFSAQGIVQTADGQEINIALELSMSRQFMKEKRISIRASDIAQLNNPIRINFNGDAADLDQTSFNFGIDSDGRSQQVSFLGMNGGVLALDNNADGEINDLGEVVGAESGNAFAALAAYDKDGNQWIDEADSIYDSLRIWSRDANGNDQLLALGDADIGAIYLGNISTPFELTTADNTSLGQIVSTGLLLKESGGVGTIQQLDLRV